MKGRSEMSYGEILPIWWSVIWRMTLVGTASSYVAGFIAGFLLAMSGHTGDGALWGGIAGFLVSIPISLWAVRSAINKHQFRPVTDAS